MGTLALEPSKYLFAVGGAIVLVVLSGRRSMVASEFNVGWKRNAAFVRIGGRMS